MKLTEEIKSKIDSYFDNILARDLYDVAVKKYGFEENIDFDIDNQPFDVLESSFYAPKSDNGIDVGNSNKLSLAA